MDDISYHVVPRGKKFTCSCGCPRRAGQEFVFSAVMSAIYCSWDCASTERDEFYAEERRHEEAHEAAYEIHYGRRAEAEGPVDGRAAAYDNAADALGVRFY